MYGTLNRERIEKMKYLMQIYEDISIARDRNNAKESCMKNSLSLADGDELAAQSRSAGTGKKTKEEIDAETAGGTRGCPVFMAVAE